MLMSVCRVGLDVHARETAAAVLDPVTGEVTVRTLHGRPSVAVEWLATLPQPSRRCTKLGRRVMGSRVLYTHAGSMSRSALRAISCARASTA